MIDGHRYIPNDDPSGKTSEAGGRCLRIALAHDWLVARRGGEMVLDAIARLVSRNHEIVGLYTMFADERARERFEKIGDRADATGRTSTTGAADGDVCERGVRELWDAGLVRTSTLGKVPGALATRRWLLPLYPLAVADLTKQIAREHARQPIDLVISTSSAAIKNLRLPPSAGGTATPVPHLCYCHAPARYLWSQADAYTTGSGGGARRLGLALFGNALRRYDQRRSEGVHSFIANSAFIARQIKEHYHRPAIVVPPPVRTDFFTPTSGAISGNADVTTSHEHALPPTAAVNSTAPAPDSPSTSVPSAATEKPWLFVGALEPYKRADLAIAAAVIAKRPLIIVGSGSQLVDVQALAAAANCNGASITVRSNVNDTDLRNLYRTSSLLLFPQVEDFGIIAVEAQACGLPIVARAEGGALDTVIDGVTGILVHDSTPTASPNPITPEAFAAAALRCETLNLDPLACRRNAETFSTQTFELRMLEQLKAIAPHGDWRNPMDPSARSEAGAAAPFDGTRTDAAPAPLAPAAPTPATGA